MSSLSTKRPFTGRSLIHVLWILLSLNTLALAADFDTDGIEDSSDMCPLLYDPNQTDIDSDGIGDVCDTDGAWYIQSVIKTVSPKNMVFDSIGNLYFITGGSRCHTSVKMLEVNGVLSTVLSAEPVTVSGEENSVCLDTANGLDVDDAGNVYVSDTYNHRILKVKPDGVVLRIAGINNPGLLNGGFSGDGGQATQAELNSPRGIAVDDDGSIYIVDEQNYRVRKVSPDGTISTIAGTGDRGFEPGGKPALESNLYSPWALEFGNDNLLYLTNLSSVYVLTADGFMDLVLLGVSGGDLWDGRSVAFDKQNALFVLDRYKHSILRMLEDGSLQKIAGTDEGGYGGNNGLALEAGLHNPEDIVFSPDGFLYVSDTKNNEIRRLIERPLDSDGDAISDLEDNCISISNLNQLDFDGDSLGDACDADIDNDGLKNSFEIELGTNNFLKDTDSDGLSDFYEFELGLNPLANEDFDSDGINDADDTCPRFYDPQQLDSDNDGKGDACDYKEGLYFTENILPSNDINLVSNYIRGIAIDEEGNIFLSTSKNNTVHKVDKLGSVSVVEGLPSDESVNFQYPHPTALAFDSLGNLYIANSTRYHVLKISKDGLVSVFAGNGEKGSYGNLNDKIASETSLIAPNFMAIDSHDNVFIVDGFRLLKVTQEGLVSEIIAKAQNYYVNSFIYHPIYKPYSSQIDTSYYKGQYNNTYRNPGLNLGDGGHISDATFSGIHGIAFDVYDNLYIADTGTHRIRKVTVDGIVSTVAGRGANPALYPYDAYFHSTGYPFEYLSTGHGGQATQATIKFPKEVEVDKFGNIYIANEMGVWKVNTKGVITNIESNSSKTWMPEPIDNINSFIDITVDNETGSLHLVDLAELKVLVDPMSDKDGDFSALFIDNCPIISNHDQLDFDNDGLGDACDDETIGDLDEDQIPDLEDNCIGLYNNDQSDIDNDGDGDVCDIDIDGDGIKNTTEIDMGLNPFLVDTDNDGLSDFKELELGTDPLSDGDLDGDGFNDNKDICIVYYNPLQTDSDEDGLGDACDIDGQDNLISTYVGNGNKGFNGDELLLTDTELNSPSGITFDKEGNLYIADTGNHRVRKVSPNGEVTTLAGTGLPGFDGDGGAAINALLTSPTDVAVDNIGNVYVSDTQNRRVRKISIDGTISTVAGNGQLMFSNVGDVGDEGIATEAILGFPRGIDFDIDGNILIVVGYPNRVRKISKNGIITSIVGGGASSESTGGELATNINLYTAMDLVVDSDGNIYISELFNDCITKIDIHGLVIPLEDVLCNSSSGILNQPKNLAIDLFGGLFASNNTNQVIKINPLGEITTIAGTDISGYSGDGNLATNAQLEDVKGIALGVDGAVYISDSGNHRIRKVERQLADSDADFIANFKDNCPLVANLDQIDLDGDGLGDVCDSSPNGPELDTDEDSVPDTADNCPNITNADQLDADGDGQGNVCDATPNGTDTDGDGIPDTSDNCPNLANTDQLDSDGDGSGDLCDATPNGADTDGDGISDTSDNCPNLANTDQLDSDGDGSGDLCDATPNGADTDGDGISDTSDNCPNLANTDQLDSDGDGSGDLCDATPNGADTDSDGIPDTSDNCPNFTNTDQLDADGDGQGNVCDATPNGTDTDGDGIPDTSDNCPNFTNTDQLDADGDGQGNVCDATPNGTDTDGDDDGIPDEWERQNGLDPLNPSDSLADSDGDGISNKDEYDMGTDIHVDTVKPLLSVPDDILINSSGPLTSADLGVAVAEDHKDGTIIPSVDKPGPFAPGHHTLTWTAIDQAGNTVTAQQVVDVIPMASFSVSQTVDEGSSATIKIMLNGSAVEYPVIIPYSISGSAESLLDHDLINGEIVIYSGTLSNLEVTTLADDIWEGSETLEVVMGGLTNAVKGSVATHIITIKEENIAPLVSIEVRQDKRLTTTISRDAGIVELTAKVVDLNPDDEHSYDWSLTNNNLVPIEGYASETFSFDPSGLDDVIYAISIGVIEINNTIQAKSVVADTLIRVISSSPELSQVIDSDGDGVFDAEEGAGDTDMDRIPDYLDAVQEPNQLPADESGALVQVDAGLQLKLGETSFASGSALASVILQDLIDHGGTGGSVGSNVEDENYQLNSGIFDFEVSGAVIGESIRVVLPQKKAIPANAVYRKYFSGIGWADFIEDEHNSISSAPGSLGVCPAPGDASFTSGLTEGDFCVQLMIEDGGSNDTDGLANGIVKDPGGVAVQLIPMPLVSVDKTTGSSSSFSSGDGEKVVLGFMFTSDSTDSEVREITIAATGDIHEVDDIGVVRLYRDANKNGQPEGTERVTEGSYASDDGEISFTFPDAYQLPNGESRFLVTYQF